jgi:16S rRNA (uracil1498-N3)-methyltransferase
VEVFDGRGFATLAEILAVGRDQADLLAVGSPLPDRAPPCELTLATAIPKGERFDWMVEKATELGVARLVPLITARSVVDPRATKLDRLRRQTIAAAKQCGRSRLLELEPPMLWESLACRNDDWPRLLAHPGGLPAREWPRIRHGGRATLAIGPEGGFTPAEVDCGRAGGWGVVSLGPTTLRMETAGVAGCSILLALCERSGE